METAKKAHKKHRVLRICSVAAAVVLFLCIVASAFGHNPFVYIYNWTEETILYRFHPTGELTLPDGVESEYHSLQEALDELGFFVAAAPTWIPSDFSLATVSFRSDEGLDRITAIYDGDDRKFRIQISMTDAGDTALQVEKAENGAVYESNGMTYQLHFNTDNIKALWNDNGYLIIISGELSQKELEQIIDSIPK